MHMRWYPLNALSFSISSVSFVSTAGNVFEPAAVDLQAMVEGVIIDGVKAFSSTSRILYSRPFRELVAGLPTASGSTGVFGAPTVAMLLGLSQPFAAVRRGIQDKFAADFAAAAEYAHVFDSVRPIYDYSLTTDWAEYRARGAWPWLQLLVQLRLEGHLQ